MSLTFLYVLHQSETYLLVLFSHSFNKNGVLENLIAVKNTPFGTSYLDSVAAVTGLYIDNAN
jgi:hypothetical protein